MLQRFIAEIILKRNTAEKIASRVRTRQVAAPNVYQHVLWKRCAAIRNDKAQTIMHAVILWCNQDTRFIALATSSYCIKLLR